MSRTFTCTACDREFTATNTGDEMIAECESLYAGEPLAEGDEYVSVCTYCHRDTLKRIAAQPHRVAAPVAFKMLREGA